MARTWWSQRFIAVLEQIGVGGRLARGRSYARPGQIVSLDVDAGRRGRAGAGQPAAAVPGADRRPRVRQGRVGARWRRRWPTTRRYAAALLAGEMPREIEEVFTGVGLSLFPASARDLAMDCTCPDHAVPCKHLAAVFYVLAERFDADPFEMLALRGRDRETLLADLRRPARGRGPRRAGAAAPRSPRCWTASSPQARPARRPRRARPPRPDALLDQVPELAVEVRGERVTDLLRPAYRALGSAPD